MGWPRVSLALGAVVAVGAVLVSGGSGADPRTPPALAGEPPPFLGTAVVGSGGLTAAIDAYGDVVELRGPGPAGRALIDNPAARQSAGTVPAGTGIVPRVRIGDDRPLPLWRASSVDQSFLPGTNVVRTVARFDGFRVVVKEAARGEALALTVRTWPRGDRVAVPAARVNLEPGARCRQTRQGLLLSLICGSDAAALTRGAAGVIAAGARGDRRWLLRARPLAADAPLWAGAMYERSLLVLRALTDRRSGAIAAGARDGWAFVWPRDASAVTLAFATAGYRAEARRGARFLLGLDLGSAARFYGSGTPVPGRGPQGDASGWVMAAARAAGLPPPRRLPWRDLPDYQEGEPGDYLGNAIAAGWPEVPLYGGKSSRRLVRRFGDPGSGIDSAAAWAVEPFRLRRLYPAARETMLRLARRSDRFGITPSENWPGRDPWSAPTAWTAWSLAALAREEAGSPGGTADRRLALRLLADLRRAATPAGALPERVDHRTGIPTSTTPLAWSHAFAILAVHELWPRRTASNFRTRR